MPGGYIFTAMPISDLINPHKGGYFYHMLACYWPITINNEVLFYGDKRSPYRSPQCNSNIEIAKRFRHFPSEFIMKPNPEFISIAFQPIIISDFDH